MTLADAHRSDTLDNKSFQAIADLAYKESGLILVKEKSTMIQSRLRHRLRALGLTAFSEYCSVVQSQSQAGEQERRHLISALTTNVSHFFREDHHFARLSDQLSDRATNNGHAAPPRIWSAGCSNGQEPLSVAMTVLEHAPELVEQGLRILATDIDPTVVQFAKRATYPERLTGGMPEHLQTKYFEAAPDGAAGTSFVARPVLRDLIRYNELNLLATWPMRSRFDTIFCRNVLIYFDTVTQEGLWPRFHQALHPNGLLFLGHSERIIDPERFGFECIGPTTYRPLSV